MAGRLEILLLGGNSLSSLPSQMQKLTALKELDLGCNELARIPDWLQRLTGLQSLGLRKTRCATPATRGSRPPRGQRGDSAPASNSRSTFPFAAQRPAHRPPAARAQCALCPRARGA
jgi:hypothetical protein